MNTVTRYNVLATVAGILAIALLTGAILLRLIALASIALVILLVAVFVYYRVKAHASAR